MATKHAKILDKTAINKTQAAMYSRSLTPHRDKLILALSNYAGARAGEIAAMEGRDVLDGEGRLRDEIFISGRGAKYGSERNVPLHPELRSELANYMMRLADKEGPIFFGRYGDQLTPNAVVQILTRAYDRAGLKGCSSHSGRRTFITQLARKAGKLACSIRDVQLLAGHADLRTTQIYIEPSENAASLVAAP